MTDAERLTELFKSVRNKSKFARDFKVPGGSSMIHQHLTGARPISIEAARAYMRGLNCRIDDISPELARRYSQIGAAQDAPQDADTSRFLALDVKASCGSGFANINHPETIRELVMPNGRAIELVGTTNKNGNVCIIDAIGDSMIPTINPGDQLFIDTNINEYVGQGIYVLLHGGELICKRLSMVGRNINVSSDNKFYDSWVWDERPDETMIVGKVVRSLPVNFKIF